jgi:hypothetical protein
MINGGIINTGAAAVAPINTDNFDIVTYAGNNSTQSITSLAFKPDFVWIKGRNAVLSNILHDVQNQPGLLSTNSNNSLINNGSNTVTFTSNGFNLQGGGNHTSVNGLYNFVAWCWKAGGAAVSNTNGNIASTVSANPDAGFSIVKYTNQSGVNTVGHGLSSPPDVIIAKSLGVNDNWKMYNSSLGPNWLIFLSSNTTGGNSPNQWNNTAPTSSVFTLGDDNGNISGDSIAYCFSSVDGYSKFGSYAGGSLNTISLGFQPRFVLVKNKTTNADWYLFDSERDSTTTRLDLNPNKSDAESNGGISKQITMSADGFNWATSTSIDVNHSSSTYIYMAFA